MPLYNVQVTLTMTMVVKAEDDDHARNVAEDHWKESISDSSPEPRFDVRGEVVKASDLRDGWCVNCHPYGGAEAIRELLIQPAKNED